MAVVFQRCDSCVLMKQQLCSKDANLMPECMTPEKYNFFQKNVSVIFCRAHIIIYKIIVNYYGLPLRLIVPIKPITVVIRLNLVAAKVNFLLLIIF